MGAMRASYFYSGQGTSLHFQKVSDNSDGFIHKDSQAW